MAATTLKQKTAKGFFWSGISNGLQQLLNIVFGICLARILSPDDYGLISMLAIFTGIATIIINSGFSTALTNQKEATQKDFDAVFWFTVFAGLFLYIVLFFCAPAIARFYRQPELTSLSRILFISFFFSGIAIVPFTVMFKQLMVKKIALMSVISLLISGIVGVFLAVQGFSYWSLTVQTVLYISLTSILTCFISPWRPTLCINFHPLKKLFSFSVKLLITNIFTQINGNFLSILLGRLYNSTLLGYYAQGQKWMGMGNAFIGGMINSVAQPVFVQVLEEKERQLNVFRKMIRFGAFVSFPLMLGLAFIGKEFILIMIGEKWLHSLPFLQLFCIWGAFSYLWNLLVNLFFTHGKSNLFMYISIAIGIMQLVVILNIYTWGIFQMVIGYLLVNFAGLLVGLYYARRLVGLRFCDVLKDILPYGIISVGCFFVAWLATKNIQNLYWLLSIKIVISAILYIFVMSISNSVIFKESMEFLMKSIKKND